MSEENNSFREKISKCLFNDCGFCKYKEKCSKQHFIEKCREENCNKECSKRHPKECKHGLECRFLRKKICAYDHEALDNKVSEHEKLSKLDNNMKIVENDLKEFKEMRAICEKQLKEIEELKRENNIKEKQSEINKKDLDDFKEFAEIMKSEIECLKKENKEQNIRIENLENKKEEPIKNQTETENVKENTEVETQIDKLIQPQNNKEVVQKIVKPKKNKITKAVIEERLINAFENDVDVMYQDFENSGLDVLSQRCNKCDHKTHSEGHLRQHKVANHKSKETKQNIIFGYVFDMQRHLKVLKLKEEGLQTFKCEECDFATHREGKLTFHKLTTHQG